MPCVPTAAAEQVCTPEGTLRKGTEGCEVMGSGWGPQTP